MNISVHHIDKTGSVHSRNFNLTRLAFVKHLAIAGQGYAPRPQKLLRTIGMFFHYSYYLQRQAFDDNRFSEPPHALSDPTEKAQFSNLAGKAIADFLSKKIDNSLFTVNYEAAMRLQGHRIRGRRPDLIAYSQNDVFSIEAKGRHQNNSGDMSTHKTQAESGPIDVNFSVACVSYDLFHQITCNYHDPVNADVPYDNPSLSALTRNYYKGLSGFLDQKFFEYREFEFLGERFYEVILSPRNFERIFPGEFPFHPYWYHEIIDFFRPGIILPIDIRNYAETGITNSSSPFRIDTIDQSTNIYIDNDRVGLRIRR